MKIFSMYSNRPAAPLEIPLTAVCFHVDPENCDCLIVDSPAVVEAFARAVDCALYAFEDVVTLDIDP